MVGYLEDIELAIDGSFKNAGDVIIMLGENKNEIGASEYLFSKTNEIKGKVPGLDINLEKKVQLSVRELIERRLIKSANDCSIGGLLITLCESAFPNNLGFALNMESCRDGVAPSLRTDAILFGETQSRIVISTSEKSLADTEKFLKEENCPYQILGKVQEKFVEIKSLNIKSEVKELKMVWEKALPDLLS